MKKLLSLFIFLVLSTSIYAQGSQVSLGQCTTVSVDQVNLLCNGQNLIITMGDNTQTASYEEVVSALGNVSSASCTLSVSGYNQNIVPATKPGGTVTLNINPQTSTVSFSNPIFLTVKDLYWIEQNGPQEITPGNFTLTNNNTSINFQDQTCPN